jgi:hypothetical protein
VRVVITAKKMKYLLAQQRHDVHAKHGDGHAFSIDLLLKDLSLDEATVARASVTIAGKTN